MDKSNLRFCLPMQEGQEDRMHLRRLQELSKFFFFFFFPPPLISAQSSLLHMEIVEFTYNYDDSLLNSE